MQEEEAVYIEELTESRELLAAREPNFMLIFILLLTIMFLIAFFWMWWGEIDLLVRATGIVRPVENVSLVRSTAGGEIAYLGYSQGERIESGELLLAIDTEALTNRQNSLQEELGKLQQHYEELNLLQESIIESENKLPVGSDGYNRYLVYSSEKKVLELEYNQRQEEYQQGKILSPLSLAPARLRELKDKYHQTEIQLEGHRRRYLVDIQQELQNIENRLTQLKYELWELEEEIDLCNIRAPIGGYVQLLSDLNPGDYLPAGSELLKILPPSPSSYRVEILVGNRDISRLRLGQRVSYRFLALPFREYGALQGEIKEISGGAYPVEEGGEPAYRIIATLEKTRAVNRRGEMVAIKPGMMGEARIVVGRRKMLFLLLEKIDFWS